MNIYHSLRLLLPLLATGLVLAQSPERHPVFEPPVGQGAVTDDNNLFLNAPVTASGVYGDDKAQHAVDGKVEPDRYWGAENLPVWLQVDMGKRQRLSAIHIWPYWKDGRIYKYKVEGSPDGKTWTTLVNQTANSITGTAEGSYFTFKPVDVRYVRTTIVENSKGKASGGHIVEIKGYAGAQQGDLQASAVSTNGRIPATGIPADSTRLPAISETAWRGERINGQIALWSGQNVDDIFLRTTDLTGPGGAKIPLKASFVRFAQGKDVPYADIIDPVKSVTLPGGTTRTVWVSADIPAGAAPGLYKGAVAAKGKDGKPVSIPVEIRVVSAVLPDPSEWKCHVDLWQHPHAVARWHDVEPWSEEHLALMKPVMKHLANIGQKNITCAVVEEPWNGQTYDWWPSMVKWVKKADGTMTYDYTDFDKWVEFMTDEIGIKGMIACYTIASWGTKVRYFDEARGGYEYAVIDPDKPEYEQVLGPFLTDFRRHLKEKGWLNRTGMGIDERHQYISAVRRMLDKYAPEIQIISAVNKPSLSDQVYDFSIILRDARAVTPEFIEKRRAEGRKTTFYVCVSPKKPNTFTHSPLAESEWLGYFGAANDYDGFLRWAFNSWNRNPFEKTDFGNWPAGDCFLVYPGGRSSLRFEKLRDGIEEFEKITMLRDLAKSPKGTPELRRAVGEMDGLLKSLFTVPRSTGTEHAEDVRKARESVNKASMLVK